MLDFNLSESNQTSKTIEEFDNTIINNQSNNEEDKLNSQKYFNNDKIDSFSTNESQSIDNDVSDQSLLDFEINKNDFIDENEMKNNIESKSKSKSKIVEDYEIDNSTFEMPDT